MAQKKRSAPSHDAAGSSQPPKRTKSTSCLSENRTGYPMLLLELESMNHKVKELQMMAMMMNQKIEEFQMKFTELSDKLNILENPTATLQTISEQVQGQYELRIEGALEKRVYTGSKVEGKNGQLLKVAIYYNNEKITSGPLASAKFEILVINGDFDAHKPKSWSPVTFQQSLAKARKEVGSILKDAYMSDRKLANGEAVLDGLIFIDNSCWVEGKKWKLGIRLLDTDGERVFEAISNCFRVLDRHGKASQKPHPPLLTQGVECLEKVGKKRALDLKKKKICTIKDFLQLSHRKPSRLLKILGIKSESDESWKSMIRHAKECDVGSNLYSYQKHNGVLFFNSVYELVGAEFGNRYRPYDKLQDSKKILVDKWKKGFYKNTMLRDFTNFTVDFEMVNGQPVPIEHTLTGSSTDDVAPQYDQAANLQYRQPTDITLDIDCQLSNTETDAGQNYRPDRKTAEHDNLIQAVVQETQLVSFDTAFTSWDDQLLGTGSYANQSIVPQESFDSMLHDPLNSSDDIDAAYQHWMKTIRAAKKAYLQLRGCTAVLLLFNHVRRERLMG